MTSDSGVPLVLLLLLGAGGLQAAEPIDHERARQCFHEAEAISARDGGALWGHPLYGPMLFVDPATRAAVANRADADGVLREDAGIFVGSLPATQNVANTAVEWAGERWTMLLWPLPESKPDRTRLLAHEMFHRIQAEIGIPITGADNVHLDTYEGRLWLQLEWRALAAALAATGEARAEAIADALVFRARRRERFPGSADSENALERNEGLAEYTGVRALGQGARGQVLAALAGAPDRPTFVRSFAYVSGPAYGILLDDVDDGWRSSLPEDLDLGERLGRAAGIVLPDDPASAAEARLARYDGKELIAAETDRERRRQERVAEDRRRFVDGPVLVLPLGDGMRYSFNPNNLETLDDLGTVYPTLRVVDRWGVLEVTGGALMRKSGGRPVSVQVPQPVPGALAGDGWSLTLEKGWGLAPGQRPGDQRVAPTP